MPSTPSIIIKNATLVNSNSKNQCHILIVDDKIGKVANDEEFKQIATSYPNSQILDAKGLLAFPGGIDPHVHAYLPLASGHTSDNFATTSKAALMGGTTFIMDFVWKQEQDTYSEAFKRWRSQSQGICYTDYAFHVVVTEWNVLIQNELEMLVEKKQIKSLKIYLAYKGSVGISDHDLLKALEFAAKHQLIVLAHCEDAEFIEWHKQTLVASGMRSAKYHHDSRPPLVEALGVKKLVTYAEYTEATVYIVHVSCEEAINEIQNAKARGVHVYAETLMPFLLLDKSYTDQIDQRQATQYILSPPLREKKHQEALWRAVSSGMVDTIASDHAPFNFASQKSMFGDNFPQIPNGLPSVEDRINLLFNSLNDKKLSLEQMVALTSTNAAKIFNLYPQKGVIQQDSDADIVLYDPNCLHTINASTHHMNVDYNPFEGFTMKGRPKHVILRGQLQVENYEWVGTTLGQEIS